MLKNKIIRCCTVPQSLCFVAPILEELKGRGLNVELLSSPGVGWEQIPEESDNVRIIVPMERRFSVRKDIISLMRLIKVFRKEKPYMVHSMTPKAGLLCMMAAWICRVPRRVHTFTGLVWPTSKGLTRKVLMITDWLTCFCATHIIPEGKGVMDDLQQYITRKPMRVLGFGNVKGVDMNRFSLRPEVLEAAKGIRDDALFTFLFVGRIVGDKGINELVSAFIQLLKNHPSSRLVLVGKLESELDPLKPATMKMINQNGHIAAVGPKYGDDLLAYYAASDCFVFPSYREGFPNTVLEAGAMGLPSIVTDINGSREIIENEVNGIIIPPKDEKSLLLAIQRMIEDEVLRNQLKSNARRMIESRFEQGFVRKCLLDFYDEIL